MGFFASPGAYQVFRKAHAYQFNHCVVFLKKGVSGHKVTPFGAVRGSCKGVHGLVKEPRNKRLR